MLAPLLRNAFLGHEKYCKNKIYLFIYFGICVSTGWFIKARGRNGHAVTEEAEFQNQLLCLWDYCYVSSDQPSVIRGRSHGRLSSQ